MHFKSKVKNKSKQKKILLFPFSLTSYISLQKKDLSPLISSKDLSVLVILNFSSFPFPRPQVVGGRGEGRLSSSDACCFWATTFQKGGLSLFEFSSCRLQGRWKCQDCKNDGLPRWKRFSFWIYYFIEASLHIKCIRNELPCSFSSYIFWVYLYRSLISPNKWMLLWV